MLLISQLFGFIESEVEQLLKEYSLPDRYADIRRWYNGYQIGQRTGIYNPWSLMNCIQNEGLLTPYWVNTSGNDLVKQLLARGVFAMLFVTDVNLTCGLLFYAGQHLFRR